MLNPRQKKNASRALRHENKRHPKRGHLRQISKDVEPNNENSKRDQYILPEVQQAHGAHGQDVLKRSHARHRPGFKKEGQEA